MGLFPIVENQPRKQFNVHLDCKMLFDAINSLNNNTSEQAVKNNELLWCVPVHGHVCTHNANTNDRTVLPSESLAAPVRHQRRQQLAQCIEKEKEKDDRGYTESVRSDVRSLLSSSALWRAPFILADSNLYVKLTSLHRLCSNVLTGAVQLHWQFYSAITQLQGTS